ncbi:MAG: hypothetical protein ACTSQF_01900 [Candidatus Heimdallarchaeaceae archaeon]
MYKIDVKFADNADKFRKAAITFEKYGYYTNAPPGTTAFMRFWDQELYRCIHGYITEDKDYITGYFYFYLNYSRIIKTVEKLMTDVRGRTRLIARRVESFPRFYDYDRSYFDAIEEAEDQGKHLVTVKKRGAGYSYKGSAMLCRNFFCIPNSKSYAIASESEFLTKDGLLTKAWEMMSFIDQHTAFAKKRQKKDTYMHKRASFVIDNQGDYSIKSEQGFRSEIMGISLKNDPQKARGKRGKLILWEEAGKFPNLKEAWQIARPSVEDNNIAFGLMVAFGTGGTEDADYEGLKDLFYEPLGYNALPVENVWDDGATKACGFFVPQYYNMEGSDKKGDVEQDRRFMDSNGNSDIPFAKKWSLLARDVIIEHSSDKTSIDRYIAERPFTPVEATLQISGNIFPKKLLIAHLAEIRNSEKLKEFKQVGDLDFDTEGKIRWELDPRLKDLTSYRLSALDDPAGAVVIWEHPEDDPPYGLYVIGCDPYDHDKSNTGSLGSAIVYKRFQGFEAYYDLPVAEYTGRPDTADEFYEKVRALSLYYKATILYENEKKGLFDYFTRKHSEHLLADQPDIIKDIIKDSKVQRGKGIHMNVHIKDWGEGAIKDWLIEEYAPGKRNLTKIFSEPLLEELIAYNSDGNFDRVMAFMMVMIYIRELFNHSVKKKKRDAKVELFKGGLFRIEEKLII